MDKCLTKFNDTLFELLNDIKTVYPDLSVSIDLFIQTYNLNDANSKDYFDYFVKMTGNMIPSALIGTTAVS